MKLKKTASSGHRQYYSKDITYPNKGAKIQ